MATFIFFWMVALYNCWTIVIIIRSIQSSHSGTIRIKHTLAKFFKSHRKLVSLLVLFTIINFIVSLLSLGTIPHSLGIAINSFLCSIFLHICILFDLVVKDHVEGTSGGVKIMKVAPAPPGTLSNLSKT
ncbi:hypothetical protein BKA69DRAFT_1075021 [Paraphysoderma sedebokerense]|nr:hypothetical protein BKA69DRAFT_1075021 [Paraphysoderma sedebokerense]